MRDCAAEALPAAETAEAEQGQWSVFCEGAATPEAKAGHRNRAAEGGGEGQNREGSRKARLREPKPVGNSPPACQAFGFGLYYPYTDTGRFLVWIWS